MKHSILFALFMALTCFGYSQKVKMSQDARGNYVSQEVSQKEQAEENKMAVYAILRSESEAGTDFMQISLDESSRVFPTKASNMQFPELIKLTKSKFSANSEVDLLNYCAEQNWRVVFIENESDEKIIRRKYYLLKMVSL